MWTNETIYPYGKTHKGKKLANIPGSYFLWLWDESNNGETLKDPDLKEYIINNMDAFKAEGRKNEKR